MKPTHITTTAGYSTLASKNEMRRERGMEIILQSFGVFAACLMAIMMAACKPVTLPQEVQKEVNRHKAEMAAIDQAAAKAKAEEERAHRLLKTQAEIDAEKAAEAAAAAKVAEVKPQQ